MSGTRPLPSADPGGSLARRVEGLAETKLRDCFQCRKCSAGCPVAGAADILPHELIGAVHLGQTDRAFGSSFLWLCVGCQTCVSRCPNRVDLPSVVDALRALATAQGVPAAEREALAFHRAFLAVVRRKGRSHELSVIRGYKRRTGGMFKDFRLGLRLWRRGKIPIFASRFRGRKEVRALFDRGGAPKSPGGGGG